MGGNGVRGFLVASRVVSKKAVGKQDVRLFGWTNADEELDRLTTLRFVLATARVSPHGLRAMFLYTPASIYKHSPLSALRPILSR